MIWLSRKRVFGLRRENMHGPLERTGTKISRVVNDLTHKEKHKDLHRPRNINQGQNQDFIANDDKVFQKSLEWIIFVHFNNNVREDRLVCWNCSV